MLRTGHWTLALLFVGLLLAAGTAGAGQAMTLEPDPADAIVRPLHTITIIALPTLEPHRPDDAFTTTVDHAEWGGIKEVRGKRVWRADAGEIPALEAQGAAPGLVAAALLAPVPEASASGASHALPAPLAWLGLVPLLGLMGLGAVLVTAKRRRAPAQPVARFVAAPRPAAPAALPQPNLGMRMATPDVPSILRAGKAAVEAGKLEEGVAWFHQATRIAPDLAVAHFTKGVCLNGLGKHEAAYDALRKAYDLDPLEGAYRLELARAAGRTGRGLEAMAALGPLLEAMPALVEDVRDDDAFAGLKDHPRFLVMVGLL